MAHIKYSYNTYRNEGHSIISWLLGFGYALSLIIGISLLFGELYFVGICLIILAICLIAIQRSFDSWATEEERKKNEEMGLNELSSDALHRKLSGEDAISYDHKHKNDLNTNKLINGTQNKDGKSALPSLLPATNENKEFDVEEYLKNLVERRYSEEDEKYIQYLMKNDMAKTLTYEQAYLYMGILIENHNKGKQKALDAYDKLIGSWLSALDQQAISNKDMDYLNLGLSVSYLSGTLYANHIVSKEESDYISEKYFDLIMSHQNTSVTMDTAVNGDDNSELKITLFCNKCGAPLIEGASFCNKCGSSIVQIETTGKKEEMQNEQTYSLKQDSINDNKFDEIRKWKSLLDEGIITQEEFEQKKKEVLGL